MSVLANSTLTQIAAPGPADREGNPGAPVAVWSGRAPAYLKRARRSVVSGGQQVAARTDVLTVLDSAGAAGALAAAGADWEASIVTVEDQRAGTPVTRTFGVTAAEHRQAGTVADSVRLELGRAA